MVPCDGTMVHPCATMVYCKRTMVHPCATMVHAWYKRTCTMVHYGIPCVTFSFGILNDVILLYVARDLEFLLNHKNSMYRVEPRFSNAA